MHIILLIRKLYNLALDVDPKVKHLGHTFFYWDLYGVLPERERETLRLTSIMKRNVDIQNGSALLSLGDSCPATDSPLHCTEIFAIQVHYSQILVSLCLRKHGGEKEAFHL